MLTAIRRKRDNARLAQLPQQGVAGCSSMMIDTTLSASIATKTRNTRFVQILSPQLVALEPTAQMRNQSKLLPGGRAGIPLACELFGKGVDADRQRAFI